ncbi:hypothetical protein [Parasediminibacterium sp. JCM 36343]|uniref:hypothetical protein n=1 Tax=Parasediminibacterium sp. JCM 36343 TaxID=3374279 RepID=UPI003978A84C
MKKITIFAILFISITFSSQGQDVGKWRAGSPFKLTGGVYTLTCFVSRPDEEWAYDAKIKKLNVLKENQEWIKTQALKYGFSVDFSESGHLGLKEDIKLPSIESGTGSGKEPVNLVSQVLYKAGYKSTLDLFDWVKHHTKAENLQVIIFAKGQGRGYSMASSSAMNKEKYFVEGTVLYETSTSGKESSTSAIAHEILHLYGAWDLYKTFCQTAENEKKARELFPNSVMLKVSNNLNSLEVDKVTAWRIEWNNEPEEWYESFRGDCRQ